MKRSTPLFTTIAALCITSGFTAQAQVSFTNANAQLTGSTHSGCSVAVVDMNGDGLDDIVRLDLGYDLYIDYQQPGQQFTHNHIGDFGTYQEWAWAMCIADVDHNGFKDVLAGGYGPAVKIMKIDNSGVSGTEYNLVSSNFFLQNANFADINGDGWEDVFGCDDNAESHIWLNDGGGGFTSSNIINFDVTNTPDGGNYGSVWTDFDNDNDIDLYIAKCRQGVNDPSDGERVDVIFVNDGSNNYTEDAASYNLANGAQTWTANFADIDNDGDLDGIFTNHDVPSQLMENDGTGHFTDITTNSGFNVDIIPIESVMEDFDNDGYVDILVTGSDSRFFHNNGDQTFTLLPDIFNSDDMESFAIGDLNHDGKIDVYASYAGIYTSPSNNVEDVYWLNTVNNGNHFITLNLKGTTSNEGALGAKAEIYGAWGKQIREVHAGESYGTCNTFNLHFGIGSATAIDSIVVRWPSGTVTSIYNPAIDQFITIEEGLCVSPDITISYSGPAILCTGQSATLTGLTVPVDYSYTWSTTETTQAITISDGGTYYVTVQNATGECSSTSAGITVIGNPDETPLVTANGDLSFCQGGSVELSGPASSSYEWSNGATSQSIIVSESGAYTLTIQGICQPWTSEPVTVTELLSPPPASTDVYLPAPGYATLTATGNNISWYDVATGGSAIGTGSTFTTPYLTGETTYYAEDAYPYNGDTLYTGQTYHKGNPYSSNTVNSSIIFDVSGACKLKSLKVYTDTPGDRLIELRDGNGNVVQSALISIPADSSRIILNFDLLPGMNYELGTNTSQNNITLGTDAPRLERSDYGVNFPYVLADLVSLNSTPYGTDYFYYFYDWEVEKEPMVCISERTPVTVLFVPTGIQNLTGDPSFTLFPNPSEGMVNLSSNDGMNGKVTVQLLDVAGQPILSKTKDEWKRGETLQFDLSEFAKGVYLLSIENKGYTSQQKIVIE